MEHKSGEIDPSSVYYVEVFYFMGNKECMLKRSYTSPSERLVIESDLPERVYPGQKVKTKLNVTNIQGRPVSNVDLTAFAVNTQLDYHVPDFTLLRECTPSARATCFLLNEAKRVSTYRHIGLSALEPVASFG